MSVDIRILESYTPGDSFPIDTHLPVDSVNTSGVASVPIRWICGPSEILPISERTGGGYSRQVISGPTLSVDVKTALLDYIVGRIEVDEAGMLAVLGEASRATVDAYAALQTFGLIDIATEQLYVSRGIVEESYEKVYAFAVNRKTLDIPTLAGIEKGETAATMKIKYSDTPNAEGLTWPEFAAAMHINLDDVSNDKDDAIEAAVIYLNLYY